MTNQDKPAVQLEIYSDVICPWCYVGKARLDRALEKLSADFDVEVTWKPFELNPSMPEGGMDRREYLIGKFGSADISGMQQRLSSAGANDGLQFNFSAIKIVPNTFNAHRLLWFAKTLGRQQELSQVLFRNYFTDGLDVGSLDVLLAAAVEVGIFSEKAKTFFNSTDGAVEVKSEARAGLAMDINSVPTFVMNGKVLASGALDSNELAKLIQKAAIPNLAKA